MHMTKERIAMLTIVIAKAIHANNAAFLFHYSLESMRAKKCLDDYKGNLNYILLGTTSSSINNLDST
jgi:hypothetical protein